MHRWWHDVELAAVASHRSDFTNTGTMQRRCLPPEYELCKFVMRRILNHSLMRNRKRCEFRNPPFSSLGDPSQSRDSWIFRKSEPAATPVHSRSTSELDLWSSFKLSGHSCSRRRDCRYRSQNDLSVARQYDRKKVSLPHVGEDTPGTMPVTTTDHLASASIRSITSIQLNTTKSG